MMSTLRAATIAFAFGAGGLAAISCGPANVRVAATVTPRLVWIAPGIWIVEDSPYAVYYADGYYWRIVDGVWYRSVYFDDAYVRVHVDVVPRVVSRSYSPAHVRYRAPAQAQSRPIIRDHRAPRRRR